MAAKSTPTTATTDDMESTSFMKNTMISSTMVSGEASETDEEDEEDETSEVKDQPSSVQPEEWESQTGDARDVSSSSVESLEKAEMAPDLQSDAHMTSRGADKTKRQKIVYKFDSPLHRKLRERNLVLRTDIVEGVTRVYRAANDRLASSTFHLTRAQSAAQDVAHNTRVMLDDLHSLSDHLDKILAPEFLPSIKMQTVVATKV